MWNYPYHYRDKFLAYNIVGVVLLSSTERYTKYLESCERSTLTIKNYLCDLQAFGRWFTEVNQTEEFDPAKITPTDLREYKRWLISSQELKPSSTNRKLASLRTFLKWARDAELVPSTQPLKIPKFEKLESPGPHWLNRLEQNALLRAVERNDNDRDRAIVRVLLNTGLRVDELCALIWQDIKLTERQGTVTVKRGKGGKWRQVPLNKDARNALLQMGYKKYAGSIEPIFTGQRGRLTPRGVQNLLSRYAKMLGLALSPHTLRHTFCKNLVDAGVTLEKVAALAGHENLNTTRRYIEPSLKDLQRAIELIGEDE
jgi:site-specific recombinase XerD